jgi:phosphoglycerate kinase
MAFKTLKKASLKNKRVIVRVDFNVPLDSKGKIVNDKKIRAALPTIKLILKNKPSQLILMTSLGRPKGKVISKLKTDNIAKKLSRLLKLKVSKINSCVDVKIPDAKIVFLENLRFYKEERENNKVFAKKLASFADIYVNDAFANSHRMHASMYAITKYLPSYAGLLLEKEIHILNKIKRPKRPFIAIIGGAKVDDKLKLIKQLTKKADKILLGGAMIFAFYKSKGLEIGKSLCGGVSTAKKVHSKKIILPGSVVVANKKGNKFINIKTVNANEITKNQIGLDVGEKSIQELGKQIKKAKTIFWNGPLGLFEKKPFDKGTVLVAKMLAKSKATVVIGGGDVVAAFEKIKLKSRNVHLSTGGGASIAFIEGDLPAIKALEKS